MGGWSRDSCMMISFKKLAISKRGKTMGLQAGTKPRIQFMNYLNIFACFAVICLHCSQVVFRPEASVTWYYSVVMQSVFIFAVPIFFMISGANLLAYQKKYSTGTFFKKRIKKTFCALLFGSILVYCVSCFCPELFNRTPYVFSLFDFTTRFFNNEIEIIYWFFYVILALYAVTPILTTLAESKKNLVYAIVAFAVITSVLPLLSRYTPWFGYISGLFGAQSFTGSIMFFLLGYYIQNYARINKPLLYIVTYVVCTICMIVFTLIVNIDAVGDPSVPYEGFFSSAFSIFAIGSSASVFFLFKSYESSFLRTSSRCKAVIQRLSAASLGVYLIHLLIMDAIAFWIPHPWSITMTIEPPIVYIITVVIVMVAQVFWSFIKRKAKKIA